MATPSTSPIEVDIPLVEDPEARSVRLQGPAFWAVFLITSIGLLLSVNQVFNLALGGFRIVSTGYYYLIIGLFCGVGFLAFPARKGHKQVRWFDWAACPGDDEDRLAQLASWVIAAEHDGSEYGLRLPSESLAPARGRAQRERCLRTLALFERQEKS